MLVAYARSRPSDLAQISGERAQEPVLANRRPELYPRLHGHGR